LQKGRKQKGARLSRDILILIVVAACGASMKVWGSPLYGMGIPSVLSDLFSDADPAVLSDLKVILLFLGIKWVHSLVALVLPVPSGCVAPVLLIGALTGRIVGRLTPDEWIDFFDASGHRHVFEARLAIVGAASFSASVLHVLSIVVTIYELIGLPKLLVPMALAASISIAASRWISTSIFNEIILSKNIPALPAINASKYGLRPVRVLIRTDLHEYALPRRVKPDKVRFILEAVKNMDPAHNPPCTLPIYDDMPFAGTDGKRILIGAIQVHRISEVLEDVQKVIDKVPPGSFADILHIAVTLDVLVKPVQVDPMDSIRDVAMDVMTNHVDDTIMVTKKGELIGLFTVADLTNGAIKKNPLTRSF